LPGFCCCIIFKVSSFSQSSRNWLLGLIVRVLGV